MFLITFPHTDLSGAKRRPAILLTDPKVARGPDGHFVYVGSQEDPDGLHIEVRHGSPDWRTMGLKETSYIRPRKIVTLDFVLIQSRLGRTPSGIMAQITTEIMKVLGAKP